MRLKTIRKSHKKEKKFDAIFVYPDGHEKVRWRQPVPGFYGHQEDAVSCN